MFDVFFLKKEKKNKLSQKNENKNNFVRLPTIHEIIKSQTTGKLYSATFVCMYVNGIAWTLYGVVKTDTTIIIANACCFLFGVIYTLIFFYYATQQIQTLKIIITSLVITAAIVLIFVK